MHSINQVHLKPLASQQCKSHYQQMRYLEENQHTHSSLPNNVDDFRFFIQNSRWVQKWDIKRINLVIKNTEQHIFIKISQISLHLLKNLDIVLADISIQALSWINCPNLEQIKVKTVCPISKLKPLRKSNFKRLKSVRMNIMSCPSSQFKHLSCIRFIQNGHSLFFLTFSIQQNDWENICIASVQLVKSQAKRISDACQQWDLSYLLFRGDTRELKRNRMPIQLQTLNISLQMNELFK